jgi:cell division protein DivIC
MNQINAWIAQHKWLNRYTLTVAAFVVWVVFIDGKFSLVKQYKLNKQISELRETKQDYMAKLEIAKSEYADLISNQEKYAREKYFISKEGEDVYIIE